MSGLPVDAERLLGFLQRCSHAKNSDIFGTDFPPQQNQALLQTVSAGAVPRGTSPYLVASAFKQLLTQRSAALADIKMLEALAGCIEEPVASLGDKVESILKAHITGEDAQAQLALLSCTVNLLFRVSSFSATNNMTPDKLAAAMIEPMAHNSGNATSETGLSILIEGSSQYFPFHKLCRSSLDKERRRLAYTNLQLAHAAILDWGWVSQTWAFERWTKHTLLVKADTAIQKKDRPQSTGLLAFHSTLRRRAITLLASAFQKWAFLLDLRPRAVTESCKTQLEVYSRWGEMKYSQVKLEKEAALKAQEELRIAKEVAEDQVRHLKKQLEEARKENCVLVEGNLAKIKYMHLIRTNDQVASEEYKDVAHSLLDKYALTAHTEAHKHASVLLDMAQQIADLKAQVEATEKENEEQVPVVPEEDSQVEKVLDELHQEYDQLLFDARDAQFAQNKITLTLAQTTLSTVVLRWYSLSIGFAFRFWTSHVRAQSQRNKFDIVMNADALRVQRDEWLAESDEELKRQHQCQALLHLRSTIFHWKAHTQCSYFALWQRYVSDVVGRKEICEALTPVVAKQRLLLQSKLKDSATKLTPLASVLQVSATRLTPGPNPIEILLSTPEAVVGNLKLFCHLAATMVEHAIRLDAYHRCIEAAGILLCMERSIAYHLENTETTLADESIRSILNHHRECLDGQEFTDIKMRAEEACGLLQELQAKSCWEVQHEDPNLKVSTIYTPEMGLKLKVEGLVRVGLVPVLASLLDISKLVDWLPLMVSKDVQSSAFAQKMFLQFLLEGPYSVRCAELETCVVDALDAGGFLAVTVSSSESPAPHENTELATLGQSGAVLKPLSSELTLFGCFLDIDLHIEENAQPLVDHIANTLGPLVFGALEDRARLLTQKSVYSGLPPHLETLTTHLDRRLVNCAGPRDNIFTTEDLIPSVWAPPSLALGKQKNSEEGEVLSSRMRPAIELEYAKTQIAELEKKHNASESAITELTQKLEEAEKTREELESAGNSQKERQKVLESEKAEIESQLQQKTTEADLTGAELKMQEEKLAEATQSLTELEVGKKIVENRLGLAERRVGKLEQQLEAATDANVQRFAAAVKIQSIARGNQGRLNAIARMDELMTIELERHEASQQASSSRRKQRRSQKDLTR